MTSDPPQANPDAPSVLTAVVPCFDAGDRLQAVVEGILAQTPNLIVVDDGCTDHSIDSVRELPLEIVSLEENRGKGHALLAGFQAALADPEMACVCVLDADGQHNPEEIPRLYAAFEETGADLVIGSRVFDESHVPWRSRFGNTVTVSVTAMLLGRRLPDTQCGFRLLSRPFLERIVASVVGGRYETEMEIIVKAIREGWHVESVPISTIYEAGNASSHFRKVQDSYRIYSRLLKTAWFR